MRKGLFYARNTSCSHENFISHIRLEIAKREMYGRSHTTHVRCVLVIKMDKENACNEIYTCHAHISHSFCHLINFLTEILRAVEIWWIAYMCCFHTNAYIHTHHMYKTRQLSFYRCTSVHAHYRHHIITMHDSMSAFVLNHIHTHCTHTSMKYGLYAKYKSANLG